MSLDAKFPRIAPNLTSSQSYQACKQASDRHLTLCAGWQSSNLLINTDCTTIPMYMPQRLRLAGKGSDASDSCVACSCSHGIQGRPVLEPLELPLVQGVVDLEAVGLPVRVLALQGEGLARRELCDALDRYPVERSYLYPKHSISWHLKQADRGKEQVA